MADNEQGAMPTEQPEAKPQDAQPEAAKADAKAEPVSAEIAAELERTREALKKANREAQERRKRLEELEAAEVKRKEAEMTDAEKREAEIKRLQAEKQDIESKLKQRDYADLQVKVARAVAKELGLALEQVEPFIDRLRGEDEEALTADAKTVFAVLPKPQEEAPKKDKPKLDPTNPANGVKGETLEERRARMRGDSKTAMYDPNWVSQNGGGVTLIEK